MTSQSEAAVPLSARGSDWADRIGADAARAIERSRRQLRAARWMTIAGVVLLFVDVLIGVSANNAPVSGALFWGLVPLGILGILAVIVGGVTFQGAGAERLRAEGYALRHLLPQNPALTAEVLATHLRRIDDFDAWQQTARVNETIRSDRELPTWTWTAGVSRPLLPGPSAYRLRQAATMVFLAWLFCMAGVVVTTMVNQAVPYRPSSGTVFFGVLAAMCLTGAAVVQVLTWARSRQEYRAGYCTLVPRAIRRSTLDVYTGVDLVDATSGYLLRSAGALPLPPEKLLARRTVLRRTMHESKPADAR